MKPANNSWWSRIGRYVAFGVVAALLAAALLWFHWQQRERDIQGHPSLTGMTNEMRNDSSAWTRDERDASTMLRDIERHHVVAIGAGRNAVLVSTTDGRKYFVADQNAAFASALMPTIMKAASDSSFQLIMLPDVDVNIGAMRWSHVIDRTRDALTLLFPVLMMGGLLWFMRREMKGGASLLQQSPDLSFDDVIGAGEAKAALADVKAWLTDPMQFTGMGVRAPGGVLMTGGPGVGKTRLAQALAGECGANFIAITGSYFSAKYYGVGIQKVKHLFELARKNAPTVIFIDEADGLGKRTDSGAGPVEAESNRIINQLLAEMDGFESNAGVIVVAATNHPDNLDEALRRPGRFDRTVQVRLPDLHDRVHILRFYATKLKSKADDLDFEQLARLTTGLSPAALSTIVNQAGLIARKCCDDKVRSTHFIEAIKIARIGDVNGAERALSDDERTRIAIHEAGHGLVAALLGTGVLEEITIMPRGGALGVALVTKHQDKHLYRETEMRNEIQVLLGGRNAELLVLSEASSGAAQDLQEASRISLDMVSKFGFNVDGDLFSLAALPQQYAGLQLKNAIQHANTLLKELNDECYSLLHANAPVLRAIADRLLEWETVAGETVYCLIEDHAAAVKKTQRVLAA